MIEIKTSPLLTELLENAKKVGNNENYPFTAERFVVAVIDKLALYAGCEIDGELESLKYTFNNAISDSVKAREILMAYICTETTRIFLDDLYMKKRMQEAMSLATKIGREQL